MVPPGRWLRAPLRGLPGFPDDGLAALNEKSPAGYSPAGLSATGCGTLFVDILITYV